MKVVKSSKNQNSRFILNKKSNGILKMSKIDSSYNKIIDNKHLNSTKNSTNISVPIILKKENIEKNKLKINLVNKSPKFLSSKRKIKIIDKNQLIKLKSNKLIIHNSLFNNNNNSFLGKEIEKSKEIKINSNEELNNNNIKKFKLYKKSPINILYSRSFQKNKFRIRYQFLLENILKRKELEFDKNNKIRSNTSLYKKYLAQNNFSRKSKVNKPTILNIYVRDNTVSTENKKNIPSPYSQYLTKTKKIYNDLNKTYSFMKEDITYDLLHDKEKNIKKEEEIKRLLIQKYDEIEIMKDDLTIKNIPIVDNYINNNENKNKNSIQNITWNIDELKNLNEDIAFKHRKFFANKYGIELKKAMLNIDTSTDDFLAKYQKSLNY